MADVKSRFLMVVRSSASGSHVCFIPSSQKTPAVYDDEVQVRCIAIGRPTSGRSAGSHVGAKPIYGRLVNHVSVLRHCQRVAAI